LSSSEAGAKKKIHKEKYWIYSLGSWVSTGQSDFNFGNRGRGFPNSELFWEDLESVVAEAKVEYSRNRISFARGYFGFGLIGDGRLFDDDFVSDAKAISNGTTIQRAHRFSRTLSSVDDDKLWYVGIDFGRTFYQSKSGELKVRNYFGYQHWEEKYVAKGITQIECTATGVLCNAAGTVSNLGNRVITNTFIWDSFRFGFDGNYKISKRFKLNFDLAYLPISYFYWDDIHHLRTDLKKNPSGDSTGWGYGFNLEGNLKYCLNKNWSLTAGYRYWSMQMYFGELRLFFVSGNTSELLLNDFNTYRMGAKLALSYEF